MSKIIVYHNTNRNFSFSVDEHILKRFDDCTLPNSTGSDFDYVAEVETNDKNEAFHLTNSLEHYWGENDEVEEFGEKHRSTSMGDIFVCEDGIYVVDFVGFKLLRKFGS